MNATSNKVLQWCLIIILVGISSCARENNKEITIEPVTYAQWTDVLKSFHSKIVVVDAWATWCESCLEKFPHMVEMSELYGKQNVQFVSLNLDDRNSPEELEMARKFVNDVNARFPHYTMNENMMDAFEKLGLMSLPVVLIYDEKGEESFRLSVDNPNQQFTEDDVEKAIQSMIAG